ASASACAVPSAVPPTPTPKTPVRIVGSPGVAGATGTAVARPDASKTLTVTAAGSERFTVTWTGPGPARIGLTYTVTEGGRVSMNALVPAVTVVSPPKAPVASSRTGPLASPARMVRRATHVPLGTFV